MAGTSAGARSAVGACLDTARRIAATLLLAVVASCSSSSPPAAGTGDVAGSRAAAGVTSPDQPASTVTVADPESGNGSQSASAADVVIDTAGAGTSIDPRVLGTNVPAWLGPERLASAWLHDAIATSGVTTIRMPGGSWSDEYGWSACELRLEQGCISSEAARPSDYAELLRTTGLGGIWTVSINETAQSAAATVAFFNGDVGDAREIGVDRHGEDWGTVGDWAARRADGGHPDPVRIDLWEVGNEVYGANPETAGDSCASFGWEDAWTCDGATYVRGDDDHDGYLAIRRAMLDVDPTIQVGAVGVPEPESWGDWGYEVVLVAGDALDFYVLHTYGFDEEPSMNEALYRPREMMPDLIAGVHDLLPDGVPIAITEYNMVSVQSLDSEHTMTKAFSALYTASMIGQLARLGVPIANHWDLANGTTSSGTDYGLVDADTGEPFPQFFAVASWGRAGHELLDADIVTEHRAIEVFPTRRDDGSLHVIIVNPTATTVPTELTIGFTDPVGEVTAGAMWTVGSTAAEDLTPESVDVRSSGGLLEIAIAPLSLVELEIASGG